MSTRLDEATVAIHLAAERLALCERLEALDRSAWSSPSLCAGWTIGDVVAHLTLATRETTGDFVRGMLRYRGNFDRMNAERARRRADEHTPDALIGQLRESAGSRSVAFGSSLRDSLIDVVVHGQDIARPLGQTWTTPPERVVIALDHAVASRWYAARKLLRHTALAATDIEWAAGAGTATISAPVIDLLLVATGRSIAPSPPQQRAGEG